jgi:hypothetical protein
MNKTMFLLELNDSDYDYPNAKVGVFSTHEAAVHWMAERRTVKEFRYKIPGNWRHHYIIGTSIESVKEICSFPLEYVRDAYCVKLESGETIMVNDYIVTELPLLGNG